MQSERLHTEDSYDYSTPSVRVTSHDNPRHSPTSSPSSTLASRPRRRSIRFPSFGTREGSDSPPDHSPNARERVDSGASDHSGRRRFLSFLGPKHSDDSLKDKGKEKEEKRKSSFSFIGAALPRPDSSGLVPTLSASPTLSRKHSKLHKPKSSDAS